MGGWRGWEGGEGVGADRRVCLGSISITGGSGTPLRPSSPGTQGGNYCKNKLFKRC